VAAVQSIATGAADPAEEAWGVAVMNILADLPADGEQTGDDAKHQNVHHGVSSVLRPDLAAFSIAMPRQGWVTPDQRFHRDRLPRPPTVNGGEVPLGA
jgi:hypothetical protein